ncbi:MAG TPA: hypothetical protein VMT30_01355 [Candidatus Saccharimonadia bacterium]|nr:hypothetical protein [Candidatus Saccharimonadia bacterium]
MKKNNLEDYLDFYLELPPTDYLKDIEIQDEYEKPADHTMRGLSDEQVSQIAADSLREAKRSPATPAPKASVNKHHKS